MVGRSFLPKGTDTVTRCPIVIRLINDSTEAYYVWNDIEQLKGNFQKENWKVADHELTDKIKISQDELLVGKDGITNEKCYVEIHSPTVVNLTGKLKKYSRRKYIVNLVVDLPGLVVNDPVEVKDGEETTIVGFKDKVNNLVREFCEKPNVLCLVISNSDTDLACNIGYSMVKDLNKVDNSIFILTKPDTLVNLPMHQAQIKKFKNQKHVFMVLNRDGSASDDQMDETQDRGASRTGLILFGFHPKY